MEDLFYSFVFSIFHLHFAENVEAEISDSNEKIVEIKRVTSYSLRRSKSDTNVSSDKKTIRKELLMNPPGKLCFRIFTQIKRDLSSDFKLIAKFYCLAFQVKNVGAENIFSMHSNKIISKIIF